MASTSFRIRHLIWLLMLALLAAVGFRLWQAQSRVPAVYTMPQHVSPTPPQQQAPASPSVDELWARYQQLDSAQTSAQSSAGAPARQPAPVQANRSAEAEQRQQASVKRRQAREQRQQQQIAMQAAREELMASLSKSEPGNIATVLNAMKVFDRRLSDAGVTSMIDMAAFERRLNNTEKLRQLNAALLSEANRGAEADIKRLQRIGKHIGLLIKDMQQPLFTSNLLNEVKNDARP